MAILVYKFLYTDKFEYMVLHLLWQHHFANIVDIRPDFLPPSFCLSSFSFIEMMGPRAENPAQQENDVRQMNEHHFKEEN